MLLSPSANRDKSWACEHCDNWNKKDKNIKIKEAENKKFYLPIGKFKLTISKDKISESKSFEILNPKK